ncbi:hypothetical protein ACLK18_05085 [Escherichia coli]
MKTHQANNVLINASPIVRLVTHLDVSREQLAEVAAHWRRIPGALREMRQRILVSVPVATLVSIWCAHSASKGIRSWRLHASCRQACKAATGKRQLP